VNLFDFIPGYETYVYDAGKEPILFLFIAFLVTFALTRLYTRLARLYGWGSGNVGGVHVHHIIPGLVLMAGAGITAFTPWGAEEVARAILAIFFGIGAALVLDEFALVFHLKDVYWSQEGQSSIIAFVMGAALAGLCLIASTPFGVAERNEQTSATTFFVTIAFNVVFALITFIKGKPFMGTIGVILPLVALVSAIRLAKPTSPWAHWFYDPERGRMHRRREKKLARSTKRYTQGWQARFERRAYDLIGGKPHLPSPD
jgi:lysyl-tRNA synthetase class 2